MSLTIKTQLYSTLITSPASCTPKVTKCTTSLDSISNRLTDQSVEGLYAQMLRQREGDLRSDPRQNWVHKYTEVVRIGNKNIPVLTFKLPDGSTRHCFERPEKMILMLSPTNVLVVDPVKTPLLCERII